MSLLRQKGFFWGVCCGLLAGLALTVTIAHAVGLGSWDKGPAMVFCYQSDSNPEQYTYTIDARKTSGYKVQVIGTWDEAISVKAYKN